MKYPFLEKRLEFYTDYFKDLSRNYHYQNYLCVNVKLYFWPDSSDLPDALKDQVTDELKEYLCENTTDKQVQMWFDWWIDSQRHFLKEWVDGCSYSSAKYWNEEITKFIDTGETSYCKYEGEKRVPVTIADLQAYKKDSVDGLDKLSHFDSEKCYFVGRSGGWFSFADTSHCDSLLNDAETYLWEIKEASRTDIIEEAEANCYDTIKDLHKYYKACEFVKNYVEESVKCAEKSFKDELLYRATESDYLKEIGFVSEDQKIESQLAAMAI